MSFDPRQRPHLARPDYITGDTILCLWTWEPTKTALGINVPGQGQVYTVRELLKPEPQHNAPYWSVLLEEIKNEPLAGMEREPAFNCAAFEKVKKTELKRIRK